MSGLFGPDPLTSSPSAFAAHAQAGSEQFGFGLAAEGLPVVPAQHAQDVRLPAKTGNTGLGPLLKPESGSRLFEAPAKDAGTFTAVKTSTNGAKAASAAIDEALFGPAKGPAASSSKQEGFGLQADLRDNVARAAGASSVSFGFEAEAQQQETAGGSPGKANAKNAKASPTWKRSPNTPAFLKPNPVGKRTG